VQRAYVSHSIERHIKHERLGCRLYLAIRDAPLAYAIASITPSSEVNPFPDFHSPLIIHCLYSQVSIDLTCKLDAGILLS
jgi:hypothetical protein